MMMMISLTRWHLDPSDRLATILYECHAPLRRNTLTDYFYLQLSRQNIYRMRALSYCSIPIKLMQVNNVLGNILNCGKFTR